MEQVQFEEGLGGNPAANHGPKLSAITRLFIKLGLAKDQGQANVSMVIVSIICLLLMSYFILTTFYPGVLSFK